MAPGLAMPSEPAHWKVLLVDDEPAVHDVSALILADLHFEGRGILLLGAHSAAQARDVLARETGIALVLLDVVMETDDAGIALVQHIRETLHDHDMQIVLRTGQPGMAPENEIVRHYEVNGYALKTEVTAQRLQTIVIAALRGYRHARALRTVRSPARLTPMSQATALARQTLRQELHADRDGRAVLLQAQPEVELATNLVRGVELVASWKSAMGPLPAARVGELLPSGPLRRRVVQWLLAQGCFWARAWQAGTGCALRVSLPLVGDSLADRAVPGLVLAALRQAALPYGALDLLVSEATLFGGQPEVRDALTTLRAAGVTVTLVDFGGQTISLQRLNQMVPDRLKLHRAFVREVRRDPERMAMARSLIALAQTLHIVAIADGIASDDDAQFFKWEGCDLGQGDPLAPACAMADLADWLQHGRSISH
ncbi:EAL domain-containing protein [Variovorax saccharolyticus]|uniref:EAL domain-containing protein n=1 Tax=Variovorax saccharolyticus TaxID=3053516 RepID=UPI002576AC04|nr:EAL domain-containing protein [Variovorax sp. J31P216]MDM0025297.1 EAL domain-containing protein [Variovorax sp. J31P216]